MNHQLLQHVFDNKNFSRTESDVSRVNRNLHSAKNDIRSMNENQEIDHIPECNYCPKSPLTMDKVSSQITSVLQSDFSHSLWNQMSSDGISPRRIAGDHESTILNLFSPIRQYNTVKSENGNSQYYENTLDIIDCD